MFHVKHRTTPVAGYATGAVSFIDLNFESAATGPIFTAKIRGPCLVNQTRTHHNMLSNC